MGLEYGVHEVFTTSLELTAVSLAAQTDPSCSAEREKRYSEITKGMSPELLNRYADLTAIMFLAILEHRNEPRDVLGEIYHELNLYQEWNGQYFTPDYIGRLMAELIGPAMNEEPHDRVTTVLEPACGSGVLIIGKACAMMKRGIDYRTRCLFVARDIDIRCVWMCYIQMVLYQIPAVVIHGNTLTGEEWDHWHTPGFYALKKMKGTDMKKQKFKEKIKVAVVVRNGFVEQILASTPECLEADVIDLDNTDPEGRKFSEERLERAKKELQSVNQEEMP